MTGWTVLAVGLALVAGWAAPSGRSDLRRLSPAGARRWRPDLAGPRPLLQTAGPVALPVAAGLTRSWPAVLAAAVVAVAVVRSGRASRARRVRTDERSAATSACTALAAELRAGRAAADALAAAAQVSAVHSESPQQPSRVGPAGRSAGLARAPASRWGRAAGREPGRRPAPETVVETLSRAAATERAGGSAAGVLACATGAGGPVLQRLAVCWQVGTSAGAGLAGAVDGLATGLRRRAAVEREVALQLSGPRATARLVAGLPVLGLLMAAGLGADPLQVLLRTSWGGGCLVLAAVLDVAGVAWTDRLVDRAEAAG